MNTTTKPETWGRRQVVSYCKTARHAIESRRWAGRSGKTDKMILLVALDFAQHMGRMTVVLPCRTVALEVGVTHKTAANSLRRIVKAGWMTIPPKVRKWDDAYSYLMNPSCPHLCNSSPFSAGRVGDGRGRGNPTESCPTSVFGGGVVISRSRIMRTSYTDAGSLDAMQLAVSELGVLLGSTAVAVCLALDGMPRSAAEIARRAQVSSSGCSRILRHKLKGHGLCEWVDGKWVRGVPIGEYRLDPNPGRVAARTAQIDRERSSHWRRCAERERAAVSETARNRNQKH